jgi:hypothetical protein
MATAILVWFLATICGCEPYVEQQTFIGDIPGIGDPCETDADCAIEQFCVVEVADYVAAKHTCQLPCPCPDLDGCPGCSADGYCEQFGCS